jgi:hypothetical protein
MSNSGRHNHVTRDIKPPGQCPACDLPTRTRGAAPTLEAEPREGVASSPEEPATIAIPTPAIPPFGTRVTADMVKDLWDVFVWSKLNRDAPASMELLTLGTVLAAVYKGLSDAEGKP